MDYDCIRDTIVIPIVQRCDCVNEASHGGRWWVENVWEFKRGRYIVKEN